MVPDAPKLQKQTERRWVERTQIASQNVAILDLRVFQCCKKRPHVSCEIQVQNVRESYLKVSCHFECNISDRSLQKRHEQKVETLCLIHVKFSVKTNVVIILKPSKTLAEADL